MIMIDSYYTSPYLASKLINYIKQFSFDNVVDFCIGDGELIRSALSIWPNIKCFGTDISEKSLRVVKRKHPNWQLGKCDLLKEVSRNRCKIMKKKKKGFDLVLLNPPFSCKGGTVHDVNLANKTFKVSTAMKFLSESIKFLTENGCLLAIMPISICYSQKDRKLWNYLKEKYNLSILEIPNGNFFKNCNPSIVFISINIDRLPNKNSVKNVSLGFSKYTIFRGKISVYEANYKSNGIPFIHSTNLLKNKLENVSKRVVSKTSVINGPAVLIPRVGKPNPQKICFISNNSSYALSDCVIAIQLKSKSKTKKMYEKIINNWENFKELYKGTGANFITIERLDHFLGNSNGISK